MKNGIRSQKKKGNYEGNFLKFDGCRFLRDEKEFGDEQELMEMASRMPNKIENKVVMKKLIKAAQKKKIMVSKLVDLGLKLTWPSIVFNLSNDPAFKFNLCVFGDKSSNDEFPETRTSYF